MTIIFTSNNKIHEASRVVTFVFFINLVKIWFTYFFNLNHQIITGISFSFLALYLFLRFNFIKFDIYDKLFMNFLIIQFIATFYISIDSQSLEPIISAIYFLIRFYLFFMLIYIASIDPKKIIFSNIIYLTIYITFIHNIFIHPYFGNMVQLEIGGNIFSGNSFDIFRANGLIGGTVVDYATLLCACMIFFISRTMEAKIAFLFLFLMFNILMNFSRAALIPFILVSAFLIFPKRKEFRISFFISLIFLISIIIYLYNDLIIDLYKFAFEKSDSDRLSMWSNIFIDPIILIFGIGLGSNTGLLFDNIKISSDSFLLGVLLDSGLFGLIFFIIILIKKILNLNLSIKRKLLVSFLIFFPLFINSGFEKLMVAAFFGLSIGLTSNSKFNKI
jgi:hypothetical protein